MWLVGQWSYLITTVIVQLNKEFKKKKKWNLNNIHRVYQVWPRNNALKVFSRPPRKLWRGLKWPQNKGSSSTFCNGHWACPIKKLGRTFFIENLVLNIFTALLLSRSRLVHLFDTVSWYWWRYLQVRCVLRCMCNITPGGSNAREVETNGEPTLLSINTYELCSIIPWCRVVWVTRRSTALILSTLKLRHFNTEVLGFGWANQTPKKLICWSPI